MKIVVRTNSHRDRAIEVLRSLPLEPVSEVEIRLHKAQRSDPQNRRFHALCRYVSTTYAERTGKYYTQDAWKIYFKDLFLGYEEQEINGRIVRQLKSTAKCKTDEMARFMDACEHYCGAELQIWLPLDMEEY